MSLLLHALVAALLLLAQRVAAAPATSPESTSVIRRDDFESDATGTVPAGWRARRSLEEGYRISTSTQSAHGGRQGLSLQIGSCRQPGSLYGSASARLPAGPYRGKRIRLEGWGRLIPSDMGEGRGQFWLRVDRVDGTTADFGNMGDRPITSPSWVKGKIVLSVAADADTIIYGAQVSGPGEFDVDDIVLRVLGPAGVGDQAARAITARGVSNLAAFGRLASVVRFFHPSDAAAKLDWNAFMIDGVDLIESANTPAELSDALLRLLAPIAPSVSIAPSPLPKTARLEGPLLGDARPTRRVGWEHRGFGASSVDGFYWSRRLSVPLNDPGPLPLGTVWSGSLGAGVYAAVPLVLASDTSGTFPRPSVPAPKPYARRPAGWTPSGRDRATRLADVLLAGGVLAQFFPYTDVVHLDLDNEIARALRSAAEAKDNVEFTTTLERLSAALHDGHGWVSGPGQPHRAVPLAFEFVGDQVAVVATSDGAGAARVGDIVTSVNGRPTADVVADWRGRLSAASEGFFRSRCAAKLSAAAGPATFELRAPDRTTRQVRVAPGDGPLPHVAKPDSVSELKRGIWYVDLDRIHDADWVLALPRLAQARGIVFDLRGYPRTTMRPMMNLVRDSLLCARWNVPLLRRPFFEGVEWDTGGRWNVRPADPHIGARVAFVVDGRAVSYAETWMAMVEAGRLGTIVGEPTAGTNGVVATIDLPGGYSMSFTGMKTLKHDGSLHHGVGIRPTIAVSRTIAGLAAGRDEALERAVAEVSQGP